MGTKNEAKVSALVWSIRLVRDRGMDRLVIEGDSMLIIKVLNGGRSNNWKIKLIIKEICTILEGFHDIHVAHTYKEGNGVANDLANFNHSVDRMRI